MALTIEDNEIHIWHADLLPEKWNTQELTEVLSEDERTRAQNFKFQCHREYFILRRYLLRAILSKYCHCNPSDLEFRYTGYQKPFISTPEYNSIKFNASFSDNLLLIGITMQREIGVDIERQHIIPDIERVAFDHFSTNEFNLFKEASCNEEIFFKIWTRKEAFIKAVGKGMYYPLKSFAINPASPEFEKPALENDPERSEHWRIGGLTTKEGFYASLAVNADQFNIRYLQFNF
ncbi:MAG: 4'-phosphopantetheinyl transferase superfamily protein [Bacteroidota bacterium]|nr:4'-phosphopantetheinyl transferase superfamily protein [Bacteroidota bacterium]